MNDLVTLSVFTGIGAFAWVASSSACKAPMVGLASVTVAPLKILVDIFYFYGGFSADVNLNARLADALSGEMVAPLRSLN